METNKTSAPSKETIIQMLSEQIEVTKLRVELQELNTKFAQLRLEELKSVAITAQITNPTANSSEGSGGIPHKLTQEDLDNNPELISKGFKVGDEVFIHQDDEEDEEAPVEEKKEVSNSKRNLRKT